MAIKRWDPWRELEDMSNRLNRLFGQTSTSRRLSGRGEGAEQTAMTHSDWSPAVDIQEDNEGYLIRAELPGIDPKDVDVSVKDGVLTLKGERAQEKETKEQKYHRVERYYGSFMRSFTLPENVDPSKVNARYNNGVLDIQIPKTAAGRSKKVKIDVKKG